MSDTNGQEILQDAVRKAELRVLEAAREWKRAVLAHRRELQKPYAEQGRLIAIERRLEDAEDMLFAAVMALYGTEGGDQ